MTDANDGYSTWDDRLFSLCRFIAGWSEDRSRKVGCVIIGTANEVRSIGFNGLPRGVMDKDGRHSRESGEKYFWFEHAERNAIYNAARSGVSLSGCRMYCSHFPCADCARAIVQSGIAELLTFAPPERDQTFSRSYKIAEMILSEGGVKLRIFPQPRIL